MILFINPPHRAGIYQDLGDSLAAIEPPLWARLLASYCERKGIKAEIVDANALDYRAQTVAACVFDMKPDLVVIVAFGHQPSASSQTMPSVIEVSRAIKEAMSDIPVLIVGGHPAAMPERTLEETGADFTCTGEGPITIAAVFDRLRTCRRKLGGTIWREDFVDIPGLCFWHRQQPYDPENPTWHNTRPDCYIHKTEPVSNVYSLTEEMPGGMWEKLPMEKYRAHGWHCFGEESRQPYASIYTTLGCPYSCSFCNIQNPFREGDKLRFGGKITKLLAKSDMAANSYRMWHPTHVVDEIQLLVEKYGVRHIKIADEMFVLNRSHVLNICNQLIERGLGDRLNVWCYARVDTLKDQALLDKMRAAGIRWCGVGIESMSEHVRDGVDKSGYGVEDILKACGMLRKAGIHLAANFMWGLPDDDENSMQATLAMVFEIMPEWANFYCVCAYPGTPLYQRALTEGWELPTSWSGYSHYAEDYLPLRTKYLTATEVLRFRDVAFQAFYKSASYQSHILTKFGPKALVEVQEMVRVPLRRKLLDN